MRKFENRRVNVYLVGSSSDLLVRFSEALCEIENSIEFCDERGLPRAELVCLELTKEGIQTCKKLSADPFLSHISIVLVAEEATSDEGLISAFDAGATHVVVAPFFFGPLFSARFRSLVSLTRARLDQVHQASTDFLTNLSSRRYLFESLKRVFLTYQTAGFSSVGCLMIDIDHLKIVNDSRGHSAGDKALIDVADLIRQSVRTDDVVARIGGDEIAVILPTQRI